MSEYFKYWGKAKAEEEGGSAYHLLPYHCLDVAAVAYTWWQQSKVIRERFVAGLSNLYHFPFISNG